jgi:hypothetical protein
LVPTLPISRCSLPRSPDKLGARCCGDLLGSTDV